MKNKERDYTLQDEKKHSQQTGMTQETGI